jgi:HlyD family secretion protein
MKYIAGFLTLSAIGCLFGFGIWKINVDEPTQFRTVSVRRDDLIVAVSASGTLEPVEIVDVGAQVIGRIKSFGTDLDDPTKTIDYGAKVKEGTVLAQIDDSTFQATVDQMQANVKKAKAELDGARARLRQAEKDLARSERLKAGTAVSEAEHDKFVAAQEIAAADVVIAEASVLQAEAKLEEANIDLGYVTIKSPIDGVVIDRRVNVGQTVVTGLNAPSLFLLARDLSRLEIWAAVNEADIGMIRVGQPVDFTVDAYPNREFTGEVEEIRLNASMTQNVVTYTVIVACENPDGKLLPYMTANLKFEVARRQNVLVVPNRALRWRPTFKQVAPEYRDEFRENAFPQASLTLRPDPEDEGSSKPDPGVIWMEAGEGLVRPLRVQVGLTDGIHSELIAEGLNEGLSAVIGEVNTEDDVGDFTSTFVRLPKR